MWGQNWGQMIWGGVVAVPAIGFWGAVLLAALLGSLGVRRLRGARPRWMGMTVLALVLLVPITARAVPFTFSNGSVADATQVNANFAALSAQVGLAPAGSSNLVDLVSNAPCASASNAGVQLGLRIGPDAIGGAFSVPTGQTLVLTTVNFSLTLGDAFAGHAVRVTVARTSPSAFNPLDVRTVTLDAHGTGSAEVSLGGGSAFGPGTLLCVLPQDVTTFNNPAITASAHGFLTTQ